MRPLRKTVFAGAAAIALVAVAGWAVAEIKKAHVLDVPLADGSVAHIHYVGDTPPTVGFGPPPMSLSILTPAADPFGPQSSFAAMERISQAMDRQAETMFRELETQPIQPLAGPGLRQVDVGTPPPGAEGFSIISTLSGNKVCTRSVAYRSAGDGKPPQVVTRTSGACPADEKKPEPSATAGSRGQTALPEHKAGQPV